METCDKITQNCLKIVGKGEKRIHNLFKITRKCDS